VIAFYEKQKQELEEEREREERVAASERGRKTKRR